MVSLGGLLRRDFTEAMLMVLRYPSSVLLPEETDSFLNLWAGRPRQAIANLRAELPEVLVTRCQLTGRFVDLPYSVPC